MPHQLKRIHSKKLPAAVDDFCDSFHVFLGIFVFPENSSLKRCTFDARLVDTCIKTPDRIS